LTPTVRSSDPLEALGQWPVALGAVARKILTLCFYGLRDGEIRCLKPPDRASAMKVMAT
jgi:hypothetical protein